MQLTDKSIKAAKTTDKQYKLPDGDGMYLLIHQNGSKYWRLRYKIAGKDNAVALGQYPTMSLLRG